MKVAIYLRQSLDVQEGIERQRERCTALASAQGWTVVEEYADNATSAGKARGAKTRWAAMLRDARTGKFDTIVSVDLDRLLRSLTDLLAILELNVKVATVDGEIDLTTADGEFRATMLAALARFEIRRKAERQKRANASGRAKGKPPVGRQAFGYTSVRDGHKPDGLRAEAVRQAYRLALEEVPLAQIARTWNEEGWRTTDGKKWERDTIRAVLTNPRYAAQVAPPRAPGTSGNSALRHDLSALQPGNWTPLVSLEDWLAVQEILSNPLRRTTLSAVQRVLTGIAVCGVCGATLRAGATGGAVGTYRCSASAHLSLKREPLDAWTRDAVLAELGKGAGKWLYTDPEEATRVRGEVRALQRRESDIAELIADGTLNRDQARAALEKVRAEIGAMEESIKDQTLGETVGKVWGAWATVENWDALGTSGQRSVLLATVDRLEFKSPGKGSRGKVLGEISFRR